MRVVIDSQIPGLRAGLEALGVPMEITELKGADIKTPDVKDADALIVRTRTRCDARLLEGSRVKFVGTATIGTDHIDLDWCEANGIRVASAPGCNAPAVMQYVACALRESGFDPRKDTLGVVGKGHIGSLVAELYRKAGTTVLVSDPPRKDAGMTDENYLTLEELLERSDALTLHVPYTTAGSHPTHHLLRAGALPSRPRIVVNASRGAVVDPGLIAEEGERRRLIIDTWPFEDSPELFTADERAAMIAKAFIATPHIAGYSIEGKRRATEAMLAALQGKSAEPEPYAVPALEKVLASFSPLELSSALKDSPGDFESLRASHLRPEP